MYIYVDITYHMDIIHFLILLLNYFWLDYDPKKSAKMYCDQHCFKIGSEVVESVWDAVIVLSPELNILADKKGLSKTWRKSRHSHKDMLWHPLSVWNGLTRSNMYRSLINADAIFQEHKFRTGKSHSAWEDCKFLLNHINKVNFNTMKWLRWFASQSGSSDTKYKPSKTKAKDLKLREQWCSVHAVIDGINIEDIDRNICRMTEPPQCINEKLFPDCKVSDVVKAYKNYYIKKTDTVGKGMRYFYTSPPSFLINAKCKLITERSKK